MNALGFAWRSLVRQPARAGLGILGVAAVGALLFDMLLLSEGLIVSMRDLLDRTGWDVRVTSTEELPGQGPRITGAVNATSDISRLPQVRAALAVRFADAQLELPDGEPIDVSFQAVSGEAPSPWTVLRGSDVNATGDVVISESVAAVVGAQPGATITARASCRDGFAVLPAVSLRVAGVAEFPFEVASEYTLAGTFATLAAACGGGADDPADLILVAAAGTPDEAASAIRAARPDLRAVTNEQMLGRFQQTGFTYFRQISAVLTTVTMSFALLLITVLLTVSVNQRLGEIAALRALGFSRRRVVSDVLCESGLIVGIGGVLSLPLGTALAVWLDAILKRMPGIPTEMHFFVFQESTLAIHVLLLFVTAVVAALYPMRIVVRLPIAATLRNEVIS